VSDDKRDLDGSAAEGDAMVGRVLAGRYRILAKLGEGAMGAVYLGEHLHIGRRDAIKLLRPGLAGDAEAIARFTRGTRNVSAIHHPNVCAIYDFSDTPEGFRYLAMEYIEGETLKDVLDREGRLSPQRAVEIARQVADALQAAHDAGVVHRDLKPGNIMICASRDGRDVVKVVDFDIAKGPSEPEGEEVTRLGFVVGTPEYMSPEQLMGDRLDGRSDLYSLGVVLFRMLSGSLPFRADSTQDIMVQRLTGEPLRLDDVLPPGTVPPPLQRALDRALARRAADRQADAAEFAREIVGAVNGASTAAAGDDIAATRVVELPASRKQAATTARSRRPFIAALLAAVLLVGGAGTVVLLRNGAAQQAIPAPEPPAEPATGSAQADGEPAVPVQPEPEPDAVPEPPVRPPAPAPALPPGAVAAVLERQLLVLSNPSATQGQLGAARDSAMLGWQAARTRGDSATAAFVLAQAALLRGDLPSCARWARQGVRLDAGPAFQSLVVACP
jgi:predicted Ser/Thr protein kinase